MRLLAALLLAGCIDVAPLPTCSTASDCQPGETCQSGECQAAPDFKRPAPSEAGPTPFDVSANDANDAGDAGDGELADSTVDVPVDAEEPDPDRRIIDARVLEDMRQPPIDMRLPLDSSLADANDAGDASDAEHSDLGDLGPDLEDAADLGADAGDGSADAEADAAVDAEPDVAPDMGCAEGFVDVDEDGHCECEIGAEVCDEADNDCDEEIDEGLDLVSDPEHCGDCDTQCALQFAGATPICRGGLCRFESCLDGFFDADGREGNGCEVELDGGTYWVDSGAEPGGDGSEMSPFDTLAGALAVAGEGSVINLADDHPGPVLIAADFLTLRGVGRRPSITGDGAGPALTLRGEHLVVEDVEIDAAGAGVGVEIDCAVDCRLVGGRVHGASQAGVSVEDGDEIVVEGVSVDDIRAPGGASAVGIRAEQGSNGLLVADCRVEDVRGGRGGDGGSEADGEVGGAAVGISVSDASDAVLRGNQVLLVAGGTGGQPTGPGTFDGGSGGEAVGIEVDGGSTQLSGNRVTRVSGGNGGAGRSEDLQPGHGGAGMGIRARRGAVLSLGDEVALITGGSGGAQCCALPEVARGDADGLVINDAQGVSVRNLLAYGMAGKGLRLAGLVGRAEVRNVTLVDLGDALYLDPFGSVALRDSILASSTTCIGTADPADILGSILSHTLTFDCEGVANIAEGEGNLLDRNPLFVDAAQRDYTLQAASPAVDGGDPLADCAAEPQEACRVDMGHTGNTAAGQ